MDTCWRCGETGGTMLIIFWNCKKLDGYWSQVGQTIWQLTDFDLGSDPTRYFWHHSDLPRHRYKNSKLIPLVNAAKACIPTLWKQESPPTHSLWLSKVADIYSMESITAALGGIEEKLGQKWFHWTLYMCSREYTSTLTLEG